LEVNDRAEGMPSKAGELIQCGGAVQLVRTPIRHAGGRGFDSRRSRHSIANAALLAENPASSRRSRPFSAQTRVQIQSGTPRISNLHVNWETIAFMVSITASPSVPLRQRFEFCAATLSGIRIKEAGRGLSHRHLALSISISAEPREPNRVGMPPMRNPAASNRAASSGWKRQDERFSISTCAVSPIARSVARDEPFCD
jgi:hypothetical protein